MSPSIPSIMVKKEDSQDEIFKYLEKIFSASSSTDALKIFCAAKNGIESSTQVIKELGLTQKRYYTNLKRLIDVGLIEKVDGAYRHTTLGKIAYRLGETFKGALDQKDKLDLVDKLLKTKTLTVEEIEEIMRTLLKDTNIIPGGRITDILGPVRMADTWDKVVNDVVEYVENATESIYFASQYLDIRAIDAVFRAVKRGVKLNLLTSRKDQISKAIRMLFKLILVKPEYLKFLFEILDSQEIRLRYVDLPYSFIVIDRKIVMVEVVKPYTKTFFLGFFFHNSRLAEKLIESFEELYQQGSDAKTFLKELIHRKI